MKVTTLVGALLGFTAMLGAAGKDPVPTPVLRPDPARFRPARDNSGSTSGFTGVRPPRPGTDDSMWVTVGTVNGLVSANGLKVYGDQIWQTSGNAQTIQVRDRLTGTLIRSIALPGTVYPMGVTRFGNDLESLAVSTYSPTNTVYIGDTLGSWSRNFTAPSGYQCRGLDWDGDKFWIADVNSGRLYTCSRAGTLLRSLTASGPAVGWFMDICLDRMQPNRLWAIDNSPAAAHFISFDTSANTYRIRATFTHPGSSSTPEGIGFWSDSADNGYCYTSAYYRDAIWQQRVHQVSRVTDVGVSTITSPETVHYPASAVTPRCYIRNFGTAAQSNFPVTCWIDSAGTRVYDQTVMYIGSLMPQASARVSFSPDWTTGARGDSYSVRMFTAMAGDSNRTNDTARRWVVVGTPPCRYFEREWCIPKDGHTIYGACVVQDSLVWVAHGYYPPNRIIIYRIRDLARIDSFNTPQVSSYGYIDLHYDRTEDVVYAGAYALTNQFDRWNATTHAYIERVTMTGPQLPGSYCFAITGDGDSIYISGFYVGIFKCAKTGGNSHLVAQLAQGSAIGLALALPRGIVFVTGSYSPGGGLREYDFRTWELILDTALPNGGFDWGGCDCYRADTFLVGIYQDAGDSVICYRMWPLEADLGVDRVEFPTGIIGPGTYAPRVRVRNCGSRATPAALARLTITGGYVSTAWVPHLNPGDSAPVTFADWTPAGPGRFALRCSTLLPGDQRTRNDVGTGLALLANFTDSFELTGSGYTTEPTSSAWSWGLPQSPRPAAHSGIKVWGGPLSGNYPNNMNWKLNTCALTAIQDSPVVAFYQWYSLENYYDGGNCKYSTDAGVTWSLVSPLADVGGTYNQTAYSGNAGIPNERCFSGGPTGWQLVAFEIPVTAGTTFLFRWHQGSDASTNYNGGWIVDDVSGTGCRRALFDLGIESVISPRSVVAPGAVVPIQLRIRNYGEVAARFDIGVIITSINRPDTLATGRFGCSLNPGQGQMFQMPDAWFPVEGGVYVLRCSTLCDSSQGYAKDTMSMMVYCGRVDCAVAAIVAPVDTVDTSAAVVPAARVRNNGTVCIPFKACFWFDSAGATGHSYFDSLAVTGLAPDSERLIAFSPWPFPHPAQTYATRCSVYAPYDTARSNDVAQGTFLVRGLPPGIEMFEPILTFSLNATPNPSDGAATISYALHEPGVCRLRLYDVTGKLIRTLIEGHLPAGRFTCNLYQGVLETKGQPATGQSLISRGIYVLELVAGGRRLSQKLIVE